MLADLDPKLFRLDWGQTGEALAAVVVLAFVVERGLALFFENRRIIDMLSKSGIKEFIALGVSLLACWWWHFDALSIILSRDGNTLIGYLLTAGVVAGGSKAAVKLFHDVMGFKSSALKERDERESGDAARMPLDMRRRIWARVQAGIGDKKKVSDEVRPLVDDQIEKIVVNIAMTKAADDRVNNVALPAVDRWAAAMAPAGDKLTVEVSEFLKGVPFCKGWPFEPETR